MNQNIKDNLHENEFKVGTDKHFIKQKKYSTPSITNIGLINKITLNGINNPVEDSGANFTS